MNIYPNFLDNSNFKYINVDDKYISIIEIKTFPNNINFLEDYILNEFNIEYSIFIEKLDKIKILKDLTYNISLTKSEINMSNNNQIDIDVLSKLNSDSKKLRYEIQINNQEIYNVFIYISVISNSLDNHMFKVKNIVNSLYSKQIYSNILNFRHLMGYLSILPLNNNLIKSNNLIFTTNNLIYTFPFITTSIIDKNGILFGYQKNNEICIIDIFNNKYFNSNMCIFGSSGSGKSYFTKILILRRYLNNIKQYIFDPEGEYENILNYINMEVFNENKKINLLDITEEYVKVFETNFFDNKIKDIIKYIKYLINTNNVNEELLYNLLNDVYNDYDINNDINSMYLNNRLYVNKRIKSIDDMPTIDDILIKIKSNNKYKVFENIFIYIKQNYGIFCGKTNVNLDKLAICFNLDNLKSKNIIMLILLDILKVKLKCNNKKIIIYIDEIWKFITNEDIVIREIYNMFKTIRKYNGGITTITQELSDFFSKDNSNFGKTILNNSAFKVFFKMDYNDKEILERMNIINMDIVNKISYLNKGEMLLQIFNNNLIVKVVANNLEDEIIKGESYDNSCNG